MHIYFATVSFRAVDVMDLENRYQIGINTF